MRTVITTSLFVIMSLVVGCAPHNQSILDPQSATARDISGLWWSMFTVCGTVFILVLWFLFRALTANRGNAPPGGPIGFIAAGGIALPAIALTGFLVQSLVVTLRMRPPLDGLTIEVVGHQWWWEVRYPESGVITANEIHIPAGERVHLRLSSADVIHSFWAPNLHGKLDMLPEAVTSLWIQCEKEGKWRGQCAEFCGTQHALMAFEVIVHEPDDFQRWIEARLAAMEAADRLAQEPGRDVFFRHGCQSCHAVRGTHAVSTIGPDLTHLGNRSMIGAGILENNPTNLAAWIADPQSLKPGSQMPRTDLDPAELEALVEYLTNIDSQ